MLILVLLILILALLFHTYGPRAAWPPIDAVRLLLIIVIVIVILRLAGIV